MGDLKKFNLKNKNVKILNNDTGEKRITRIYEYKIKDKNNNEVIKIKKVNEIYVPSNTTRLNRKLLAKRNDDILLNTMRKTIARCLQYGEINIQKNIDNNVSKNNTNCAIFETVIYRMQEINATNMLFDLIDFFKDNLVYFNAIKKKYPKLMDDFVNMCRIDFGMELEINSK